VQLLANSLPPQLLGEFQQRLNANLAVTTQAQISAVYDLLQRWQQPNSGSGFLQRRSSPADLVTLGDSWLAAAIAQNLIQPLAIENSPQWQQLPQRWKTLVQRDGKIWAAPYRWGTLMIIYRKDAFDKLGWQPQDWADLWRSPLQGKLGLLDSPRVAIGVALPSKTWPPKWRRCTSKLGFTVQKRICSRCCSVRFGRRSAGRLRCCPS